MRRGGKELLIYVTGTWAFLPTTMTTSRRAVLYVKVPACVAYVNCPGCDAKAGERCDGTNDKILYVHAGRKNRYQSRLRESDRPRIRNCGVVRVC